MFSEIIWRTFFSPLRAHLIVSGATLGITDKMEARPQLPLLVPQAQTRDEGVRPCDSDLFFPFFGWVGWKEC